MWRLTEHVSRPCFVLTSTHQTRKAIFLLLTLITADVVENKSHLASPLGNVLLPNMPLCVSESCPPDTGAAPKLFKMLSSYMASVSPRENHRAQNPANKRSVCAARNAFLCGQASAAVVSVSQPSVILSRGGNVVGVFEKKQSWNQSSSPHQ